MNTLNYQKSINSRFCLYYRTTGASTYLVASARELFGIMSPLTAVRPRSADQREGSPYSIGVRRQWTDRGRKQCQSSASSTRFANRTFGPPSLYLRDRRAFLLLASSFFRLASSFLRMASSSRLASSSALRFAAKSSSYLLTASLRS